MRVEKKNISRVFIFASQLHLSILRVLIFVNGLLFGKKKKMIDVFIFLKLKKF